jgi:formate-dependent phosphoribosylglycinamide formyltransferase (GAR transformylase)
MTESENNRKKVLLLGSSFSSIPILKVLLEAGFHVSVCGSLPEDPAHAYAHRSYFIDYSDESALEQLVNSEHFDFICPTCNDASYMAGAKIAASNGMPGFDNPATVRILHDKKAFREFADSIDLPVPRLYGEVALLTDFDDLRFPILVKPVDSFSGRGITRVDTEKGIEAAMREADSQSGEKRAIAEEFVDGELLSHSVFIKDGRIIVEFFVDEFCTVYPYQVNCSNVPSSLPPYIRKEIGECTRKLISELNLTDGLLHIQLIANEEKFWYIECMRRAPGDLYYEMIRLASEIDGMDFYVRPFVGISLPEKVSITKEAFVARHTISVSDRCQMFSFRMKLPGEVIGIVPLKQSGGLLAAAPFDKLGIVFCEFPDLESLHHETRRMADFIQIESLIVP